MEGRCEGKKKYGGEERRCEGGEGKGGGQQHIHLPGAREGAAQGNTGCDKATKCQSLPVGEGKAGGRSVWTAQGGGLAWL